MAPKSIATNQLKSQPAGLPELKAIKRRKRNRAAASDDPCYVYFMENRKTGEVKVGRTVKPQERVNGAKDAKGTNAGDRAYWGWITVARDIGPKLEAALHREWADVRISGEWFDLSGKAVAEDAHRVAYSVCGPDFKIVGLAINDAEPEDKWHHRDQATYRLGGIIGPRLG